MLYVVIFIQPRPFSPPIRGLQGLQHWCEGLWQAIQYGLTAGIAFVIDSLKEKQKIIKRALTREGGIEVSFDVPKWAYIQTLLSRGDRRVGKMLLTTYINRGDWKATFRSSDVNPDFFVYRPKELNEQLPWDFIDHGIKKSFLKEEYRLSLKSIETPPCDVGNCTRCGVCN